MIYVIASIELVPDALDEFLRIFFALVPKVQAEKGCLEYGPMVDVPTSIPAQGPARPNVVTIVEKWESVEALEMHLMALHMLEYRKAAKELVRGVTLQILRPA